MTAGPIIDYEALAQDAMRGLVRTVLTRTAKSGLPGDHHFYISFDTQAPGVVMSKRLREKYPAEMTIVLQHRFWDLFVSEERFEVKLTFDGIPERLVVPFPAIKVFFDPSVRYGLQFEEPEASHEGMLGRDGLVGDDTVDNRGPLTTRSTSQRKPRGKGKTKPEKEMGAAPVPNPNPNDPAPATQLKPQAPRPLVAPVPQPAPERAPTPAGVASGGTGAGAAASGAGKDGGERPPSHLKPVPQGGGSAQVVSLDSFRKK